MKGYSNYWIFPELGMVWSIKSNKWIGAKSPNGYWKVKMYDDDGDVWQTSMQRVIWTSVHGDIPESMEIHHLNENKDINCISNLSCVSHLQNCNFGSRNAKISEKLRGVPNEKLTNRKDQSKTVGAYLDDVLVMTFPSTQEARRNGYNQGAVAACCRNCYLREGNNVYKSFTWKYLS